MVTRTRMHFSGSDQGVNGLSNSVHEHLIAIAPQIYSSYVVYEKGKRVIYVIVVRAIYGMLVSALLWFKKFKKDLESMDFRFNDYDACVANRIIEGKQHTIRFHVDDLMSSHMDKKVNDRFYQDLQKLYGKLGAVTEHRGTSHDYLGVIYRYHRDYLELDMRKYVADMLQEFPIKFKGDNKVGSPARSDIFEEYKCKFLDKERKELFHRFVAKGLFLCKRGRPDILFTIAILCTRVKQPTEHDWKCLVQLMRFLYSTKDDTHKILVHQDINIIKWFIDASFAVHPDFKSHTGGIMYFNNTNGGSILSVSTKQKLNTKSSTEAELVAVDDVSVLVLWTKLFLEDQGYFIKKNIIYQDNKSAILLETNGKSSSGKRTRAFNIRYFFITDQVFRGNASIVYCPTDQMAGDFNTKPLQGRKYTDWRVNIMNPYHK